MTTVFLSGSRKICRLADEVRGRIGNMASTNLGIVIGDANGADKAMQSYLASISYANVTVFCAGDHCRNNVGRWSVTAIPLPHGLSGRLAYEQKDKAMAKVADFGFVVWDGASSGSVANMSELLKDGKKVVVYHVPTKRFYNLCSEIQFVALLSTCNSEILDEIDRKVRLPLGIARRASTPSFL